jgi:hypothetical protein
MGEIAFIGEATLCSFRTSGDDRSRAAADQFIGLLADQVGALRSANNRG